LAYPIAAEYRNRMKLPSSMARMASPVPRPCWIIPPITAQIYAIPNPDQTSAGSLKPRRALSGMGFE
jgi:hypothetical protein